MQNTPPKKITFLLTSLISGGEERIASVIAAHLAQKQELHLVLFNHPIDFELPAGLKVKILRPVYSARLKRIITLPLILWRYYQYCQEEEIEHSISFDNLPNFINCGIKLLGWKGKAYLREVNHVSTRFPATTMYGRSYRWLIRKLYPSADQIFMNAERIGTDLQQNYGLKVPMAISDNPIDLAKIAAQSKAPVTEKVGFTFIHVGAFRPQKNHQLLIEAFAKLKHLPIQLWLVGKGPLEASIKEQIIQLDLADKVVIWGFQTNPFKFMVAADCMVMSSHFEGLPNVFLEALACGLPIISTDCPSGPREIIALDTDRTKKISTEIELAKYGILTPVGNAKKLAEAMKYVYENPNYRKGDFFKKRVEPFRVERIVEELMEYLNT